MNILGQRINQLRKDDNLNQLELAKVLNISNTTLSQYESGQRIPSDDIKILIADYFKVSTDYLLGKSDIKNPYINIKQLPTSFNTAEEAMQFILKDNNIMAHGGFDINKLTNDEKIQFTNELLEQLKLVSYKYKKK